MDNLQIRVKDLISSTSLFNCDKPIIIAVSGGADSISLLHLLSAIYPSTTRIAVYVDHELRPLETQSEKELVRKQAHLCSAHFESVTVDVKAEQQAKKCSLEEAARILRYQALENIRASHSAAVIAVGHTADDQAEEVLLRLIRGSGSTGLSGMNLQHGCIVRPLLGETKETLLHYLKEQQIPYCEDSSNLDPRFLRNRIRLELLPELETKYNPSIRKTLLQTATILDGEDKLLEKISLTAYQKCTSKNQETLSLSLPYFLLEPIAIQRRILDRICWTMESKPSYKKIQSLLVMAESTNHKELHLSGGLRAMREEERLTFHRPSSQKGYRGAGIIKKTFTPISISETGIYPVSELDRTLLVQKLPFAHGLQGTRDSLIIDAETVSFPFLLRQAKESEWFYPLGAPGKKKISRFLSDHKVPAMKRDSYPLILTEEKVLMILGMRIDHDYRVTEKTEQVLRFQWQVS